MKDEIQNGNSIEETKQFMSRKPKGDAVDGPAHYKGYDVLEIINRYGLGFETGNAVKYILRASNKGGLEDLKKARFYLDWLIERAERERKPVSSIG